MGRRWCRLATRGTIRSRGSPAKNPGGGNEFELGSFDVWRPVPPQWGAIHQHFRWTIGDS